MSYIVNFTDSQNKLPITVFDNISSDQTSVIFPGRNVSGYGKIIAENFLHILENFAKDTAPLNPVEGQLWYDTGESNLKLWDNSSWKAAGSVQRGTTEPATDQSKAGELWVDTSNQQLYLFSGARWILVGPTFSTGLRSGPLVESIVDSDNISRVILTFYVDDVPVIIFSKEQFTPKLIIDGFTRIRSGLNITTSDITIDDSVTQIWGTVSNAETLGTDTQYPGGVPATKFLRSDKANILDLGLTVRNNSGLTLGTNNNFRIYNSETTTSIYNNEFGGSVDLQVNRSGIPYTTLRVTDNKVGINIPAPEEALEVGGNAVFTGSLIVSSVVDTINPSSGSIRTAGGVAIGKKLRVGDSLDVDGLSTLANIVPKSNELHDLGTDPLTGGKRWNTVRAKTLDVDNIIGDVNGNISGNASTATNLKFVSTFQLTGDVISPVVQFDGLIGGTTKVFNTVLTAEIISQKPNPPNNQSTASDTVLVFRPGTGLLKETRDVFISDAGVPIGSIMPFAGTQSPPGYLLCDGSEVERGKFPLLFDVIGTVYNGPFTLIGVGTFRLPDLRGRFPLGRDNMDNGSQIPTATGGQADAGGGNADRVPGTEPDTLGASTGSPVAVLSSENVPNHEHSMVGSESVQYYAFRPGTNIPLDSGSFLGLGPSATNAGQYLPSSGGVKTPVSRPFSVINPFLTLNYIIRSGPPAF